MELLLEQPVAQFVSDMRMPDIDGLELCQRVSRDIDSIPFILFSACIPTHYTQEIDATIDVWGRLRKPSDNQRILSLVEEVLTASTSGPKSPHSQTINK